MNLAAFVSIFFVLITTAKADYPTALRQAKITVLIKKSIFKPTESGIPAFDVSDVCTKESLINVYQDVLSITPEDLSLVRCDGELQGQKVSVVAGGAVLLYQDTSLDRTLKSVTLALSWGPAYYETPMLTHSASSDPWLSYQAVLSPVSVGKIVDNVPQPPEPSEYFSAIVMIQDQSR